MTEEYERDEDFLAQINRHKRKRKHKRRRRFSFKNIIEIPYGAVEYFKDKED